MTREEVGSADLLRSSDEHRRGFVGKGVGVWGERAVVDETHDLTRRYPKPLMPVAGVRVKGFTISLDLELTRNPEAAALGRRVFEQVRDAIEHVIGSGYADAVREQDESHVASVLTDAPVAHVLPEGRVSAGGSGDSGDSDLSLKRGDRVSRCVCDVKNERRDGGLTGAHLTFAEFSERVRGAAEAIRESLRDVEAELAATLHDASPIASAPGLDSPDSGVSVGEPAPRGDGFPPASPEAHTGGGAR